MVHFLTYFFDVEAKAIPKQRTCDDLLILPMLPCQISANFKFSTLPQDISTLNAKFHARLATLTWGCFPVVVFPCQSKPSAESFHLTAFFSAH